MFGLRESDISEIKRAMQKHSEIESAYVFGSRAQGTYKDGSDIDIVLKGKSISSDTVTTLQKFLNEETQIPYFFDIVNYNSINNKEFIDHIDKFGQKIYLKG